MNELFLQGRNVYNTDGEAAFLKDNYPNCENISIDYGIMEKARNVYVLPVEFGWSDLGTWASLYSLAEKDQEQNVVIPSGGTILTETNGCMINIPDGKKLIIKGLQDYIIAESNNTIMIIPRESEQEVKQIVADVKAKFGENYI
jgi:mannose-1-phosphate guanylyltransferase